MSISASQIKQVLSTRNVMHLYHANTVATSITFLQKGGLLSRGAIRERGLFQTWQKSDDTDDEVGVFSDIFMDSVDIHGRSKSINYYGPVLFVFSVDLLDELQDCTVKITRSNPAEWIEKQIDTEEKRYFTSETQLAEGFCKGTFGQSLTICDFHEPLPFTHLEKVILDNPQCSNNDLFTEAKIILESLITDNAPKAEFEVRTCSAECQCKNCYKSMKESQLRRFFFHFRKADETVK